MRSFQDELSFTSGEPVEARTLRCADCGFAWERVPIEDAGSRKTRAVIKDGFAQAFEITTDSIDVLVGRTWRQYRILRAGKEALSLCDNCGRRLHPGDNIIRYGRSAYFQSCLLCLDTRPSSLA